MSTAAELWPRACTTQPGYALQSFGREALS
jgi:hypothetical protein